MPEKFQKMGMPSFWMSYITVKDIHNVVKQATEMGGINTTNRGWDASTQFKWRTVMALILVYVAVLLELQWVWGLLFLLWLIPDIRSGQVHLVEEIRRDRHPILYWFIIGTWLWLSIYLLATIFV